MKYLEKHIWIVLSLILFQGIYSCKQYSIDNETKDWIPYKPGQNYLFQDDAGNVDTLRILKIERFNNPEDHLAIISPHHEKIIVDARIPDHWTNPMGTTFNSSIQTIIVIDANTNNTTIDISFKPYDFFFESTNNDLSKIKYETRTIRNRTYTDLITFKCNNNTFCGKDNSISEIIWSAENGIVEYVLGNKKYTLKEILKKASTQQKI